MRKSGKSSALRPARPDPASAGTAGGRAPRAAHEPHRTGERRRARRTLGLVAAVLVCGTAAGVSAAADSAGAPVAADSAAQTTARARVGSSDVVCRSHDRALAHKLSGAVAAALRPRHSTTAVALYDRASGTSCAFRASAAYDSASVVKATLLGALLRQAEEDHRTLTPQEKKRATAMITTSDNDATSALWSQVGRGGVQHFLDLAGMQDTEPGPRGSWGLTQVTARDEVKLLELLTSRNRVLDAGSRAYALDLMGEVVPGQRWGTPAGAPEDARVQVKNGWLPRATHGWRINSVGAFTDGGHDYGVAVLSQDNRTMAEGVDTVEAASRAIHRGLAR
ncbi:Beta-lactamase class A [Streptomyces qinglanensis]|uniref:Beta-lactamase class A n=1 Tax=Streptomyces qinglanensis TaxID=943816 RepID=A0A1H9QUB6_9ACTN|nr:Beta-lactamase class A [Streptomyces qinglanensis]